jgi:hypothetical protein
VPGDRGVDAIFLCLWVLAAYQIMACRSRLVVPNQALVRQTRQVLTIRPNSSRSCECCWRRRSVQRLKGHGKVVMNHPGLVHTVPESGHCGRSYVEPIGAWPVVAIQRPALGVAMIGGRPR